MNRIIVAGGLGFFGSAVLRILRAEACEPQIASRRPGADLILDVENRASIRKALRPRDVIVDATAPFHKRTATLIDEAIAIGADVVDLSDNLGYARLAWSRNGVASDRGVRVLNACSSVSVLSAFAIERSGFREPIAIHGFLAPATRRTANRGVTESLLASVGQSIIVRRAGEWHQVRGWMASRTFAELGRSGRLTEMADAFTLPRVYPSIRNVDFWVDPNTFGAGALLDVVAHVPALSPIARWFARHGMPMARMLGRDEGILAYEVEGAARERSTVMFTGAESFLMAAIPAALAAARLASGEPYPSGVVPVHQHISEGALADALIRYGIRVELRPGFRP